MPCRYLPSVSQPSKIVRGVISNQHALVGSMGFSRPLLQPEWHQHISVFGSLLPSPLVVKQPKSIRVPPRPRNSSQRAADDVAGVHARRFRIRLTGRGTPGEGSFGLNRTQIPESCFPENGVRPLDSVSKWRAWGDSNARPLVPKTISNEKANLLNENQKVLQPSQVQPVQQKWQIDLRRGEMRQVA